MVAFNFHPDFIDDIIFGRKRSTIRQKRRCNVGDSMQLYTGQRTKHCKKLMETKCIGVANILIGYQEEQGVVPWALKSYEGTPIVVKRFVHQEGFINEKEMMQFFDDMYGLPFEGWLYTWDFQKSK